MPAPPKPENVRNPLRLLRGLLSEAGKKHSITQRALSELIDVPGPTIKAIEAGQRGLTYSVLLNVLWGTCAQLDEDGKAWICAFEWNDKATRWEWSEGRRPFTYSVWEKFRKDREQRPPDDKHQLSERQGKLFELFEIIPDKQWWALFLSFHKFVEERWNHYEGDKLRKIYDAAQIKKAKMPKA